MYGARRRARRRPCLCEPRTTGEAHHTTVARTTQDPTALYRIGGAIMSPVSVNDATPLAELPVHGTGRWFDDWIAHPDFDEYWKSQDWSAAEHMSKVSVP